MSASRPLVIAHRGASGYLPEHTLAAKALAHACGADFLEQDVVATADDELVVLHDIHLDRVTDVATVFPGRSRVDGRYYVRDFSMAELRRLRVTERVGEDGRAVYPGRYPAHSGEFRVHTLAEELALVAELNRSLGRTAGVYPEIKRPAWHREEGVDLAARLLAVLEEHGYAREDDPVRVQCFDAAEVRRLREELGCRMPVVQLIGDNAWGESSTDYDALRKPDGLARVAGFADAIGPWLEHCYALEDGRPVATSLVGDAHAAGLDVHPYTVRADSLPPGFTSHDALVAFCADELGVDGLFTDFPDRTLLVLEQR